MKQQKGFTLIELLVVIAIIGLLSTLAIVALNSARQKSRDARRLSDVKQIQTALELYFNDQSSYPGDGGGAQMILGQAGQAGECMDSGGFKTKAACTATPVYMAQVPTYPQPFIDGTACNGTGGGTGAYIYKNAVGSTYRLQYCIANATGGIVAGVNTACETGVSGCTAQ